MSNKNKKDKKDKKNKENQKKFRNYPARIDENRGFHTPEQLEINNENAGVFFGKADVTSKYVGMPQGTDGNIIIVGGSGSGKSTGIIEPTLKTWRGAICATDIKGELSRYYEAAMEFDDEMRPYIIFDPTQPDGLSYDPFWWVQEDDEANLYTNIMDIAYTIMPEQPEDKQPFWRESERSVFAAGLLYYYQLGLSFSECLIKLLEGTLSGFIKEATNSDDLLIKTILGETAAMKGETLANFDRGFRNKLFPFVTDPYISHVFRGKREGAPCFTWKDLEQANVFLRIPGDKIGQWSGAINLMYAQLIRYLERRPDKYSREGGSNIQTLLLFDEFPQFGKLEMVTNAISTLRSKSVNMCIAIQSVAQLDLIYGELARRIIFDNCQYQLFLRANDPETQAFLGSLIGSTDVLQESVSKHVNEVGEKTGYSMQRSKGREPRVFPHDLSTLNDVLVASPYGVSYVEKLRDYSLNSANDLVSSQEDYQMDSYNVEEVKILTMEDRLSNANKRLKQQRIADRQAREKQKKLDSKRNYRFGKLLTAAFPELQSLFSEDESRDDACFQKIEMFLKELAEEPNVIAMLHKQLAVGETYRDIDV